MLQERNEKKVNYTIFSVNGIHKTEISTVGEKSTFRMFEKAGFHWMPLGSAEMFDTNSLYEELGIDRPDRSTLSFGFVEPVADNFTPSRKIYQFSKANGCEALDRYGSTILCYRFHEYSYDHFTIENNGDGTETVTIFLREEN